MGDEMLVATQPDKELEADLLAEVLVRRRRFTTDEYYRMAEAGILGEDDRVELLDGVVIRMTPIGPPHAGGVNRLQQLLVQRFTGRAVVAGQNPVIIGSFSVPQPDIALLRFREDFYATRTPRPQDVLLVIEVGDSTAAFDRRVKLPLYARAGLPEVWLLDLRRDLITVHRGPTGQGYTSNETYERGRQLAPEAYPEDVLEVAELLGAPP
jgi:Uma2 family endonuclease